MPVIGIEHLVNRTTSKIAGKIPTMTVASERANKCIEWLGKEISSPENRLIMGATALMSQPFIDLNNKKVDEETRHVSACRTVAKIIAGTTTGVLIRKLCIKAIDFGCKIPQKGEKLSKAETILLPSENILKRLKDLSHYKKALGTIISLGVMVFTNFLIDAPLTKFLTNKFVNRYHKNQDLKSNLNEEVKRE